MSHGDDSMENIVNNILVSLYVDRWLLYLLWCAFSNVQNC